MVSPLILFPLWAIVFVLLLVLLLFILWIWAIVHCLSSRLNVPEKLLWLVVIVLLNVLGALLYFILSRSRGAKLAKEKSFKGKRLFRSRKNRIIAGVCGGIGEYLEIDPTVVRLVWVLLVFLSFGAAIIAYIIAWIIVPEK
ncbi:PspC domain-containing protein [Candidatus Woesearchaeota archaeon]|nr:PspC domain-containing protein [Candidatus Woesearchaeota archaeon]